MKYRASKVQVIETETGEVVRDIGPVAVNRAERIQRGVEINLNHERFHTDIEDVMLDAPVVVK